ncbi:hypothetical protein Y032_0052g2203 [Ancylostoma ceylanicum]|uniref:Uncharacterized protein n=1 Tax=Ancylostoma ceylanicum TaxID=53326 RepID=A0A016U7F7_9BILA|nr:hypothetical protein Y032_0052g2203 [Ancylostoma ceylanicum]
MHFRIQDDGKVSHSSTLGGGPRQEEKVSEVPQAEVEGALIPRLQRCFTSGSRRIFSCRRVAVLQLKIYYCSVVLKVSLNSNTYLRILINEMLKFTNSNLASSYDSQIDIFRALQASILVTYNEIWSLVTIANQIHGYSIATVG